MNYSFSRGAKSRADYDQMLNSLSSMVDDFSVNREELLHFFDMHYLRKTSSWLWGDQRKHMLDTCGGFPNYFTSPIVLSYWAGFASENQKFENLLDRLEKFMDSDRYMLSIE